MASDAKNIDTFNRAANDPELWRLRGLDLHTAAEVLRETAVTATQQPDWSNLSLDDPGVANCFKFNGLIFQSAMLQGFATECLLKCYWITRGNKVAEDGKYKIESIERENHDLPAIADGVEFNLSDEERTLLTKLSSFTRSFGRYPIAKKWQEQRLVKNEHGIDTVLSWDNEDHALAEWVLARLKSETETSRKNEA
jgi:hypothetical protein